MSHWWWNRYYHEIRFQSKVTVMLRERKKVVGVTRWQMIQAKLRWWHITFRRAPLHWPCSNRGVPFIGHLKQHQYNQILEDIGQDLSESGFLACSSGLCFGGDYKVIIWNTIKSHHKSRNLWAPGCCGRRPYIPLLKERKRVGWVRLVSAYE